MPAEQSDLDRIVESSVTETAKQVLCGLLQLQPSLRSNLLHG